MVNGFILFGRPVVFVILALFQGGVLIKFLVKHHSIKNWFFLAVPFPAFIAWIWHVNDIAGRFRWMFVVWLFHVGIGLVPFVGTIFALIKNKFIAGEPYGADSLKLILCVSPLLLLILLNDPSVETDSSDYRVLITDLSYKMTIDFFDGVDMLSIILQENEGNHGIPTSYESAIVALVCISFLLSPMALFGHKVDENDLIRSSNAVVAVRIVFQVCFNTLFLALRVVIHLKYGVNLSVFTAKNVIMILIALFKVISFLECCEKEHEIEV